MPVDELDRIDEGDVITAEIESMRNPGVALDTDSITVGEETDLSAAFISEPTEPTVDEDVTFDAIDSEGEIVEYRWDLTGDSQIDETTADPTLTHTC